MRFYGAVRLIPDSDQTRREKNWKEKEKRKHDYGACSTQMEMATMYSTYIMYSALRLPVNPAVYKASIHVKKHPYYFSQLAYNVFHPIYFRSRYTQSSVCGGTLATHPGNQLRRALASA